jgi:hypothetical protein
MRHCSGSSVKHGSPIRSPYRISSSARNTQRDDQTFVPIATSRVRVADHCAASEAGDIGGSLRTGISVRTRFAKKKSLVGKESHKTRLSAPGAARSPSIVPRGARRIGARRTDEHGMQRNQEVEVSNHSVNHYVIVIGGGAAGEHRAGARRRWTARRQLVYPAAVSK